MKQSVSAITTIAMGHARRVVQTPLFCSGCESSYDATVGSVRTLTSLGHHSHTTHPATIKAYKRKAPNTEYGQSEKWESVLCRHPLKPHQRLLKLQESQEVVCRYKEVST